MNVSKLFVALFIFTVISCKKEKNIDYIILSGMQKNHFSDSIKIFDKDSKKTVAR